MTWLVLRAEIWLHLVPVAYKVCAYKPDSQWNLQPCWTLKRYKVLNHTTRLPCLQSSVVHHPFTCIKHTLGIMCNGPCLCSWASALTVGYLSEEEGKRKRMMMKFFNFSVWLLICWQRSHYRVAVVLRLPKTFLFQQSVSNITFWVSDYSYDFSLRCDFEIVFPL